MTLPQETIDRIKKSAAALAIEMWPDMASKECARYRRWVESTAIRAATAEAEKAQAREKVLVEALKKVRPWIEADVRDGSPHTKEGARELLKTINNALASYRGEKEVGNG